MAEEVERYPAAIQCPRRQCDRRRFHRNVYDTHDAATTTRSDIDSNVRLRTRWDPWRRRCRCVGRSFGESCSAKRMVFSSSTSVRLPPRAPPRSTNTSALARTLACVSRLQRKGTVNVRWSRWVFGNGRRQIDFSRGFLQAIAIDETTVCPVFAAPPRISHGKINLVDTHREGRLDTGRCHRTRVAATATDRVREREERTAINGCIIQYR